MTQRAKMKNPSLKSLKKTLTDCARDPRSVPYSVVAETGTPDYLITNAVVQLRAGGAGDRPMVEDIRAAICDLGLALVKIEAGEFDPDHL